MITFNINYLFYGLAAIMSLSAAVLVIYIKLVIRREQELYNTIKSREEGLSTERNAKQMLLRYHTVFNSSLLDMVYYDKDGIMRDINDTACKSFRVADRQQLLDTHPRLSDNPLFSSIGINNSMEGTRTTSIVDFDKLDDEQLRGLANGVMYYESTINPIRNADGELQGIYMAGRGVTEMVRSFHRQQEGAKRLRNATDRIMDYVTNINNAMRLSSIRLVNYYPDSYTLEVSDDVNQARIRLSQVRCVRIASPQFRRTVSIIMNRMDHRARTPINTTIELVLHDKQYRPIWLMFNLVPMIGSDGRVERYFGMCRDVTDMVETERRLAVETRKAQETELLKQSFLTNMSYEIRTPLNTVIGFAELFESEHDIDDESVFVDEIKRNSNILLLLVNDILFLSRLDAKMIEYSYDMVDFSMLFESFCQTGWSAVSPQVRTVIDNPYNRLMVKIDVANVGLVIQRICALSIAYTTEGSVRATYEYRHGELGIRIEDTGKGLDAESLKIIFDRFARIGNNQLTGTGLDLPIAKALVEQMGGAIELQSELGKGTTVWVSIPCEAEAIERKREITV